MPGLLLDLLLGFAIGLSLGMLGGGGSILTVPALVYLVGQTPQAAVTTSLAIVGMNSAVGAVFHNRAGGLDWKIAGIVGGAGMIVAYFAAGLSKLFSPSMLMVAFAGLMLVIGGLMFFQTERPKQTEPAKPKWWMALISGVGVGLLTGVLGVGGGFLIVPALVMLVGLSMYQAVATSLVVIAANSLAGLLGHLNAGLFDLSLTFVFVLSGLFGTLAGTKLAHKLPAKQLRKAFALFVIALAVFLLRDNLPKLLL